MTIKTINAEKHNAFIASQMEEALQSQSTYYAKVHKVCVLVAYHAMRYKDNSGANIILDKLGNGTRKQGVVNWFGVFCGFKWDDKKGEFTPDVDGDFIHNNIKAAKAKPWYDMLKKERTTKPMDINDDVVLLVNHLNKIRSRKVEGDVSVVSEANLKNLIVALGIPVMDIIEPGEVVAVA